MLKATQVHNHTVSKWTIGINRKKNIKNNKSDEVINGGMQSLAERSTSHKVDLNKDNELLLCISCGSLFQHYVYRENNLIVLWYHNQYEHVYSHKGNQQIKKEKERKEKLHYKLYTHITLQ